MSYALQKSVFSLLSPQKDFLLVLLRTFVRVPFEAGQVAATFIHQRLLQVFLLQQSKLLLKRGMDLAEEVATLNGDLAAKLASVEWSRDGVGLRIMDQPGKRHCKALILSRPSRCFWACDVCTEDLFQGVGWHANIVLRHLCPPFLNYKLNNIIQIELYL